MLFMIPLRRQLIVKAHGNLSFPEGTACADVLVAGEKGGSFELAEAVELQSESIRAQKMEQCGLQALDHRVDDVLGFLLGW